MYNSQEVAKKIKSIAKDRGISIGKMLADCELSKNALSSMQAGGYLPRIENIIKIADYLNCSIDSLLGRNYFEYATETETSLELTTLIAKLVKSDDEHTKKFIIKLLKLPPESRKIFITMLSDSADL